MTASPLSSKFPISYGKERVLKASCRFEDAHSAARARQELTNAQVTGTSLFVDFAFWPQWQPRSYQQPPTAAQPGTSQDPAQTVYLPESSETVTTSAGNRYSRPDPRHQTRKPSERKLTSPLKSPGSRKVSEKALASPMQSPKAAKGGNRQVSGSSKGPKEPKRELETPTSPKQEQGKRVNKRTKAAGSRNASAPISRKASTAAMPAVPEDSKAPAQPAAAPVTPPQQTQGAGNVTAKPSAIADPPAAVQGAEKVTLGEIAEDVFKGSTTRPPPENDISPKGLPEAEVQKPRNDATAEVRATPTGSPTRQPRRPGLSRKGTPSSAAALKPEMSAAGESSSTAEATTSTLVMVRPLSHGRGIAVEAPNSEAPKGEQAGEGSTTAERDEGGQQTKKDRLHRVGRIPSNSLSQGSRSGPAAPPSTSKAPLPESQPGTSSTLGGLASSEIAEHDIINENAKNAVEEPATTASCAEPNFQTTKGTETKADKKILHATEPNFKVATSTEPEGPSRANDTHVLSGVSSSSEKLRNMSPPRSKFEVSKGSSILPSSQAPPNDQEAKASEQLGSGERTIKPESVASARQSNSPALESRSSERVKRSGSPMSPQKSAAEAFPTLRGEKDKTNEAPNSPDGSADRSRTETKIDVSGNPDYPSLAEAALRPKSARRNPPHERAISQPSNMQTSYSAVMKGQPTNKGPPADEQSSSPQDRIITSTAMPLDMLMQPWQPKSRSHRIKPAVPKIGLPLKRVRPGVNQLSTTSKSDKSLKPAENCPEKNESQSPMTAAKEKEEEKMPASVQAKKDDKPSTSVDPTVAIEEPELTMERGRSSTSLKQTETTTSVQTKRGRPGLQITTSPSTRSVSRDLRTSVEPSPFLEFGQSSATLTEGMTQEKANATEVAPVVTTHKKSMKKKKRKPRTPLPTAREIASMVHARQPPPANEAGTKEAEAPDPPSTRYGLKAGDIQPENLSSRFESKKTYGIAEIKKAAADSLQYPDSRIELEGLQFDDPQWWMRFYATHPEMRPGRGRTNSESIAGDYLEKQMQQNLGHLDSARLKASISLATKEPEAGDVRHESLSSDIISSQSATNSPRRLGQKKKTPQELLATLQSWNDLYSMESETRPSRGRSRSEEDSPSPKSRADAQRLLEKLFDQNSARNTSSQETQIRKDPEVSEASENKYMPKASGTGPKGPHSESASVGDTTNLEATIKGNGKKDGPAPTKTLEEYMANVGQMKAGTKIPVNSEGFGELLRKHQTAHTHTPSTTSTAFTSPEKSKQEETASPKSGKKKTGKSKHKSRGKNSRTGKSDTEGSPETKKPHEHSALPKTAKEGESSTNLKRPEGVRDVSGSRESKSASSLESSPRTHRIVHLNPKPSGQGEPPTTRTGAANSIRPLWRMNIPSERPSDGSPTRTPGIELQLVGFQPTQPDRPGSHRSSSSGEMTRDELKETYRRRDKRKQQNLMNVRRKNRSSRSISPPMLRSNRSEEPAKSESKVHKPEPGRFEDPEEAESKNAKTVTEDFQLYANKATNSNETESEGSSWFKDDTKGKRQGLILT